MFLHNLYYLGCNILRIGIGAYFAYFRRYLKKDVTHVTFDTRTQTAI